MKWICYQVAQEDEVVADQHEAHLVNCFYCDGCWIIVWVDLEKINNVEIAHVDEQVHLDTRLVRQCKHHKYKQGSASKKHHYIGQRQKIVYIYAQVERANFSFHAWSPQICSVSIKYYPV